MDYFSHALALKRSNPYLAYRVYHLLYETDLRWYARKIYNSRAEDALDAAYIHILRNYDDDKGDLEHYATTVVGTINLGVYKNEIVHDEVTELALNQTAYEAGGNDPYDIIMSRGDNTDSSSVDKCVEYMLPYMIRDFRFFKSKKAVDRTLCYSELYKLFDSKTILEATGVLMDTYDKDVEEVYALKKSLRFRSYPEDRYLKSMDETISYVCDMNGILVYKLLEGKANKVFYEIDLDKVLREVVSRLYVEKYYRCIGGVDVYCTLSGKLVFDLNDLMENLENEIVGFILSRLQTMRVFMYERGSKIILVASRVISTAFVVMEVLEDKFLIGITQRISRCIE